MRGKNLGGLAEDSKKKFQIRMLQGNFQNNNLMMERLIILYDKYNSIYESEIKCKPDPEFEQ